MKIERAKELLSGNFNNPDKEFEEELNEALAMLETNEELQTWMEQQEQMDSVFRKAITESPVPDGLEKKLLATVGNKAKRSIKPIWLGWGGAVAAIVVLGFVFFSSTPQGERLIQDTQVRIKGTSPDSFDHFRDGMAYFIREVYFKLDHTAKDMDSIENWLIDHNAPVFESIPSELLALDPIGCKELQWKGRDVSLVCFHTGDGGIIHMFILDRQSVDENGLLDISTVAFSHDLETGGWMSDEKVYLLVGSDPTVDIEFALG